MANQIRIKTSVEIVQDVGASAGAQNGITYTSESLDGNADYRAWGGSHNISTAYTDNDVAYWKNVIISATSADAVSDSGWTEASGVTDGTLPSNVYVVAVEYVEQTIGADSIVQVTIGSQVMAKLAPGESIVIPVDNLGIANVKIHDANYANGTREAKVNVMVAGT
tara:strand:- start:368 stop:865 length:498 start_codon:yes stop_codon:yes gene_type:complete